MYTSKPFGISHFRILAIIAISLAFLLSSAQTLAQSGERPRAPELYIPITTHSTVLLKWWEADDPAKLGIRYVVQRKDNIDVDWHVVDGTYGQLQTYHDRTVGIPFTDSSVSPNTVYTYRVYAIKGDLRSDSSRRMRAVTEPAPEGNVQPVSTPVAYTRSHATIDDGRYTQSHATIDDGRCTQSHAATDDGRGTTTERPER